MHSIALEPTLSVTRRDRAAVLLALPLGLMTIAGGVVFWEWSALTFVSVIALAMGAAFVTGATRVLRGDLAGARILLAAAVAQVLFTVAKLAVWQETEAGLFGLVALAVAALLRGHARG
jgi:hypothetical protein